MRGLNHESWKLRGHRIRPKNNESMDQIYSWWLLLYIPDTLGKSCTTMALEPHHWKMTDTVTHSSKCLLMNLCSASSQHWIIGGKLLITVEMLPFCTISNCKSLPLSNFAAHDYNYDDNLLSYKYFHVSSGNEWIWQCMRLKVNNYAWKVLEGMCECVCVWLDWYEFL